MSRKNSILILICFSIFASFVAFWGIYDVVLAINGTFLCKNNIIIDHSAFWFSGMLVVPLFLLLVFLPQKRHYFIFAVIVALWIAMPYSAYLGLKYYVDTQGYTSKIPLSLWQLEENTLLSNDKCQLKG